MRISRLPSRQNYWQAATSVTITLFCLLAGAPAASAQSGGVAEPWQLDPDNSTLTFQSVKKGTVVETSKFAKLEGTIAKDGAAEVKVMLDSVDTGVDLRNVRMRFLFFETYKTPVATITTKVDPDILADLQQSHRLRRDLDYKVSLHGVEKDYKSPVVVTMIDDNSVSVASAAPVIIPVADFNLAENITKLEQAVGNITITPTTSVSFDLVFKGGPAPVVVATADPSATALESKGDLAKDECTTRFDVLSQTQAIYFRSGSFQLQEESWPLLETVVDIAKRCPDLRIEVAGYTDSDGPDDYNQRLSEQRASVVAIYLEKRGVEPARLSNIGFGEQKPVADNITAADKARNRRIEFHASGG